MVFPQATGIHLRDHTTLHWQLIVLLMNPPADGHPACKGQDQSFDGHVLAIACHQRQPLMEPSEAVVHSQAQQLV